MDDLNQNEQVEQMGSEQEPEFEKIDYLEYKGARLDTVSLVGSIHRELLQQRFWGRKVPIAESLALWDEAEEIAAVREPIFAAELAARRSDPERMEERKRRREELIASGGEPTEEQWRTFQEVQEFAQALLAAEKRVAAKEAAGAEPDKSE